MVAGLLLGLLGLFVLAGGAGPALAEDDAANDTTADDEVVELEVESPDRARDRGSVEGELAPDGELRRAWVRRHVVDDQGGDVEETLEELDEELVPIVVRVQYELDGESVPARELRGATGQAVVRIQLRNPTTETREIEVPDGRAELDLSLPMVAEGLVEFDDTWRDVRTDGGRIGPAPDGGTRLRWSAALFEPVASSTSRIEIRGEVDGATLPQLEVEAIPATAGSDLFEVLRQQATDAGTGDAVAAFIADNLGEGLVGAAEGADGLAGGLEQTTEGAGELNAAIREMQVQIEGGFDELEDGLDQLDAGLAGISEALAQVETGLAEIAEGLSGLADGLSEARDGARTLTDEIAAPSEAAIREAWDVLAEQFSVGRADPAYVDALTAVGELHALLTGEPPPEPTAGSGDAGTEDEELAELLEQVAELTGPDDPDSPPDGAFDDLGGGAALDDYPGLTASLDDLAGGLGEATRGAEQLAGALDGVRAGVGEIRTGVEQLRAVLSEAGAPGAESPEGEPGEMDEALGRFEGALRELASGGQELAGGIRQLASGGDDLLQRLEGDLAEANLDLATVEALADRAGEHAEADDPGTVGGHDRYLLVFAEETTPMAPAAALAGLLVLGGTLEVLRRRLTAV